MNAALLWRRCSSGTKGAGRLSTIQKNLPSVAFWNGIARRYAVDPVESLGGVEDCCNGTPSTVLCFDN